MATAKKKTAKAKKPTPREALLARNDARSKLETLGAKLIGASAQGLDVTGICNDIHALSEVADG